MQFRSLVFVLSAFLALPAMAAPTLSEACQKFADTLPANYKWGTIEVPEDWSKPTSKKLNIFYYWNAENKATPILYFNGGPRKDSKGSFNLFKTYKHTDLPLLIFDQRGNGCSDAPSSALSNIQNWTSQAIVRDAEAIRKKVYGENSKWKVFGHSYGTVVAFRYLTTFPNSIHTLFTSSFGMMSDGLEFRMAEGRGQERIFREQYLKKYPDNERILTELQKQIPADMCTKISGHTTSLCGAEQLDALGSYLLENIQWDAIDLWLQGIAKQYYNPNLAEGELNPVQLDKDALANLVAENIFWGKDQDDQNPLHHGILYHEVMPGVTPNQGCKLALAKEPPKTFFSRCRMWSNVIGDFTEPDFSSVKPVKVEIADIKKVLVENPHLKVFTFTGQNDYRVPPETYAEINEALKGLSNYQYILRAGHDHHTFVADKLLWETLAK